MYTFFDLLHYAESNKIQFSVMHDDNLQYWEGSETLHYYDVWVADAADGFIGAECVSFAIDDSDNFKTVVKDVFRHHYRNMWFSKDDKFLNRLFRYFSIHGVHRAEQLCSDEWLGYEN